MLSVLVTNPSENTVVDQLYRRSKDVFSFISQEPGEHKICIKVHGKGWQSTNKIKVVFQLNTGEDNEEDDKQSKLDEIQLQTYKLTVQAEEISKEQEFQRVREEKFRRLSETTEARLFYWSFFQLVIVLATGFWQMNHLRNFFQLKKIL
ncbi:transmembrane emp24 domain-containing protein eca-like [Zophobas morio]|uniref:transmembrane emp24 domain-containing protein eca-like n=1 Tax=Zophobas morio TaxID=2755281 RepID=UPI0030831D56